MLTFLAKLKFLEWYTKDRGTINVFSQTAEDSHYYKQAIFL